MVFITHSKIRKGFLNNQDSFNESIVEEVFWRVEELWDAWPGTRLNPRSLLIKSLILNIQIILTYGSSYETETILAYAEEFEANLKNELCTISPSLGEKLFKNIDFKQPLLLPEVS